MANASTGPPPMSPALAPPIKKQRAGGTPQDSFTQRADDAVSRRRAALQKLNHRAQATNPLMDRARMSLGENNNSTSNGRPRMSYNSGGPPPTGSAAPGGPPPPMHGYTNQPQTAPPMRTNINNNGPPTAPPAATFSPQPYVNRSTASLSTGGPPPHPAAPGSSYSNNRFAVGSPPGSPNSIKNTATGATSQNLLSPTRSKVPSPRMSGAAVTAAAVMSPKQPRLSPESADRNLARRLETTFSPPNNSTSRSKSAPPSRPPPPPPGPPPLTKEAPERTPKAPPPPPHNNNKGVAFASPVATTTHHETPEETTTPYAAGNKLYAGTTPFPGGGPPTTPGATHNGSPSYQQDPEPTPKAPKDLLHSMREAAETPSHPKKQESPELRLQRELAHSLTEKSDALRKISQLESEIQSQQQSKGVSFMSPTTNFRGNRGFRAVPTPYPKRLAAKPTTPKQVQEEKERLVQAAQSIPFEYEYQGDNVSFLVRRPYGLANEAEVWFKVGQLNNKMYSSSADVEFPSTIELAAILEDNSIFCLHGTDSVQHHKHGGGSHELKITDSLSVIDNEGNEKEHQVAELLQAALTARSNYCSTVIATADALKDHSGGMAPAMDTAPSPPKPAVPTSDKGINTDALPKEEPTTKPQKKEQVKKKQQEPPPDDGMDVIGTFLYLFGKIFGLVWFIVVGLPLKILTHTIVVLGVGVLISVLWLYFVEDNGAMEMAAVLGYHSNPAAIQ